MPQRYTPPPASDSATRISSGGVIVSEDTQDVDFTAAEVVSALSGGGASEFHGAFAFRSTNIAVSGTSNYIELDTVVYDTDGYLDPAGDFVIPAGLAGLYQICAIAIFDVTGDNADLVLSPNIGSHLMPYPVYVLEQTTPSTDAVGSSTISVASPPIGMAVGDSADYLVGHTSASPVTIFGGVDQLAMSIQRIGDYPT